MQCVQLKVVEGCQKMRNHMLYSIIGTADKYGLNMQRYLTWLLRQVAANKITAEAIEWLPHRMSEQKLEDFRD